MVDRSCVNEYLDAGHLGVRDRRFAPEQVRYNRGLFASQ